MSYDFCPRRVWKITDFNFTMALTGGGSLPKGLSISEKGVVETSRATPQGSSSLTVTATPKDLQYHGRIGEITGTTAVTVNASALSGEALSYTAPSRINYGTSVSSVPMSFDSSSISVVKDPDWAIEDFACILDFQGTDTLSEGIPLTFSSTTLLVFYFSSRLYFKFPLLSKMGRVEYPTVNFTLLKSTRIILKIDKDIFLCIIDIFLYWVTIVY